MSRIVNKYFSAIKLTTFISCVYVILRLSEIPTNNILICVFPFIFYLFTFSKSISEKFKSYLSVRIIILLGFIKYVIIPVLMIFNGIYNVFPQSNIDNFITKALFLMIFEMIAVFSVLKSYKPKYYFSKQKKQNKTIVIISLFLGLFGIFLYPGFINNIIWLKSTDDLIYDTVTFIDGWQMGVIYYFVKFIPIIILILTIIHLRKKGIEKNKFIKLSFLLITAILSVVIVYSENRGQMVSQGILIVYMLSNYFPSNKKLLSTSIYIILILGVIFSTSYRLSNTNEINVKSASVITEFYSGNAGMTFLDSYLSGPSSVAQGLKAYSLYKENWSYRTLLNDIIINTQVLNQISYRIFDTNLLKDRTSVYYANVITGSKIPPLILSGYIYAGFLFSPIFGMIAVFLALRFEDYSKNYFKDDIFMHFCWLYISIRFSFFLGLSISVLYGLFATYFFPMWLVFKLNNKLKLQ